MKPVEEGQDVPAESAATPPHALPAGLTPAAREAFRDVEEEFREGLSRELRRRRRSRRDLTSDDVYDARVIVAHEMRQSQPHADGARSDSAAGTGSGAATTQRAGSLRALGTGLIAVGSVGVGSMHPYLHSLLQVAVLVLFCLVGLAGVGLAWRGGRHGDVSGESAG